MADDQDSTPIKLPSGAKLVNSQPPQQGGQFRLPQGAKLISGAPSFPQGNQPATLPNMTNEDMANFGRGALSLAPVVGATAATMLAPEASIPAMAGYAALGGMAGEGARQGTLAATHSPGAPQSIGEAAMNTGRAGIEQGVGDLTGRLLAKPLNWALDRISPTRLMGSSLRPPPGGTTPAGRNEMIQTMLRERIPVSDSGLDTLDSRMSGLADQAKGIIAKHSGQPGTDINPADVLSPIRTTRQQFGEQVTPRSDVSAIDTARQEFLDRHSSQSPFTKITPNPYATPGGPGQYISNGSGVNRIMTPINLADAQAEKQGTYKVLHGKYGELGSADTEAQKSLARGLKDQIAARAPEVAPVNERMSKLSDVRPPLASSINREANRQTVGLRIPLIDNPELKSTAAIGMSRVAQSPIGQAIGPIIKPNSSIPFAAKASANSLDPKTGKPYANGANQ